MQIERETVIAAPVERVWALLTEAEHVGRWFCDDGAEIDLRPGGAMVLRWTEHGTTHARVVDVYSIKPIDAFTLRTCARETGCLVTVEDHWAHGGLGDAVMSVFTDGTVPPHVLRLAVREMPGSATPEEQLRAAGIDRTSIASAIRSYLGEPNMASS
jgi:transketolase C-terminal domain/subunit